MQWEATEKVPAVSVFKGSRDPSEVTKGEGSLLYYCFLFYYNIELKLIYLASLYFKAGRGGF